MLHAWVPFVDGFGSSASSISVGSSAASNTSQSQQQEPQQADDSAANKQLGEENDSDLIYEDCTPERLQVHQFLLDHVDLILSFFTILTGNQNHLNSNIYEVQS